MPRVETVKWVDDTWVFIATGMQIVWIIDMREILGAGNKVKPRLEDESNKTEARSSNRQKRKRVRVRVRDHSFMLFPLSTKRPCAKKTQLNHLMKMNNPNRNPRNVRRPNARKSPSSMSRNQNPR